jgi:hypothetical protein
LSVLATVGGLTGTINGPTPTPAATQAQVNSGTSSNTFVTPATLYPLLSTDPYANLYVQQQAIQNANAVTALSGFANSGKNFGIYSNLVSAVFFEPQFNPSNQLDYFGRPFNMINPVITNNGAQFYYTNSFNIGGFSLTNYTLVVTISRQFLVPNAASGGQGFNPTLIPQGKSLLFSFESTNTGSGNFVDQGEYFGTGVIQRSGGTWPYATNDNNFPQTTMLSQLNNSKRIYAVQKSVYCLSCVGGTNYLWVNTLPCYQNGLQAITNPVTSGTDPLQQIYIGISTNYIIPSWSGDRTNSTEVVESVMLFNSPATPANLNMVYGSYQMAQWPDWYIPYQFTFGDSILAPFELDLAGYLEAYTNNFSYLLSLYSSPSINWMNLAQGGATLGSCLTNGITGQPFPITPVSLLPQLMLGVPVTIYSCQGRNDCLVGGLGNPAAINNLLTQFATPYKQLGAKWIQIAEGPCALTNLSYSVLATNQWFNTNIAAFNNVMRSNPVVNGVLNFDWILNTNNMVMGAGQSNDGVHPYTNTASAYYQLAKLATGIPLDGTVVKYTGSFFGSGAGIQPTFIQTNFVLNQTYTNAYGVGITIQANVVNTLAAVAGDSSIALIAAALPVNGGWTNYCSFQSGVTTVAASYTNCLSIYVPTNALYWFTNVSAGAGNSVSIVGGQIKYP